MGPCLRRDDLPEDAGVLNTLFAYTYPCQLSRGDFRLLSVESVSIPLLRGVAPRIGVRDRLHGGVCMLNTRFSVVQLELTARVELVSL